ncbi:sunset domain-containing protein [Clostridium sp.]|jgi:hypothetical protein|nr:hypothetical protein [Clostridium sp.]
MKNNYFPFVNILHGDPYYDRTNVEEYFNTGAEAQAVDYRPIKR